MLRWRESYTKKARKFRSSQARSTVECLRTRTYTHLTGERGDLENRKKNTRERAIQETQETSSPSPGTTLQAKRCPAGEPVTSKDRNHLMDKSKNNHDNNNNKKTQKMQEPNSTYPPQWRPTWGIGVDHQSPGWEEGCRTAGPIPTLEPV